MWIKKKTLLILFLAFFFSSQAQNIYKPKNIDSLNQYLENITEKRIELVKGKFKAKKKNILKKHLKDIQKQITDSSFVFIPDISTRLNTILSNIYRANPNINPKDFYFIINKSIYPNAAAYGDGLFVVNLGLFSFLDSDDEIAFILCHEIGHLLNDDVNNAINNYVETINSKETKKEIRKIDSRRYGKTRAGLEFIKDLSYNIFKHSRLVEINADLLGYSLFAKTDYNKNAAITTLKKLGALEELIFNKQIDFNNLLGFKTYPFNNNWITKEESMFNSSEVINDYKFNKDSLKSHPHAKERILKVLQKNSIDTTFTKFLNEEIIDLKSKSYKVLIKTLYDDERLDLLLYLTLTKIQSKNGTTFDYENTAQALSLIYDLKKEHVLGKKIPQVSPFSDEKHLNEIKRFIHKIELGEIKRIAYHFTEKNKLNINKKTYNRIINKFKPQKQ